MQLKPPVRLVGDLKSHCPTHCWRVTWCLVFQVCSFSTFNLQKAMIAMIASQYGERLHVMQSSHRSKTPRLNHCNRRTVYDAVRHVWSRRTCFLWNMHCTMGRKLQPLTTRSVGFEATHLRSQNPRMSLNPNIVKRIESISRRPQLGTSCLMEISEFSSVMRPFTDDAVCGVHKDILLLDSNKENLFTTENVT